MSDGNGRLLTTPAGDPEAATPAEGVGRREFLRVAGFSVGATALFGCTPGKEHHVIPYLIGKEEITPGRAYWYASVCGACPAACGILAKARDGRPIKLEGNPGHPVSGGGLCAMGQASVLSLYDSHRLRKPLRDGATAPWADIDREIALKLEGIRASGGRVRFLTDSVTGPAERDRIAAFLSRFADGRHVTYDPVSASAIADAHAGTHGARVIPRYRFDRAEVIVGVAADFLGTWISPVEHTAGYRAGRRLDDGGATFSHHIQFESRMSLTGSNADRRFVMPPGGSALVLAHLAGELAVLAGGRPPWSSLPPPPVAAEAIAMTARRLHDAPRGRSLVVCGDNDIAAQRLANHVNHLLGNDAAGGSSTIDLGAASSRGQGDDAGLRRLLDELEAGNVDALFVRGGNPVYDLPGSERMATALEKVGLVVSFASHHDETARLAGYVCPEPHFLESWGDSEPVAGYAAIRQPAIRPIGGTRPMIESLAAWSGSPATAYDQVREVWRRKVHPRSASAIDFDTFWDRTLNDGFVRLSADAGGSASASFSSGAITAPVASVASDGTLLAEIHASPSVLDGRHALNPWLQELPDPVGKTVWDNFAVVSPGFADRTGIADGDVVRVASATGDGPVIELPALIQPGQHDGALSIALGYGRRGTERFTTIGPQWWEGKPTVEEGSLLGANAAPLLAWSGSSLRYSGLPVRIEKTGRRRDVACTQRHHTLEVPPGLATGEHERRPIVQETTLAAWRRDPSSGSHAHEEIHTLWPEHPKKPHHWGMAIDLSACTGCSACVIACQAENNVPVVGKDEVFRAREMHWMRIDRYYSGEGADVRAVHMPMMCQHCDNAPCETVCPVQATAQSADGLNQQVYNRCVGTRYCANNCPYKVRRFNWFQYARDDEMQNLVLNPDVTVRSRGVMEKCSLCVQRIQDAKAESRRTGLPLRDGDIQPACAQSCPAEAIVFGDSNDPESRLMKLRNDPRHYEVLAETGVRPVVGYLSVVRDRREHGEG